MSTDELAAQLVSDPRWAWHEGMRDRSGGRVVDLDLWVGTGLLPDLDDLATAGVILGVLVSGGWLTDVAREDGEWIVAVEVPGLGLRGWAADTLGRAAAFAMLSVWDGMDAAVGQA